MKNKLKTESERLLLIACQTQAIFFVYIHKANDEQNLILQRLSDE